MMPLPPLLVLFVGAAPAELPPVLKADASLLEGLKLDVAKPPAKR
ncbi:hypothetical protein [Hyalangium gracile]|nr:hypothetical protein [Hyalangium gracile]